MEVKEEYDIIIVGAGASGLSLLWRLMHSEAFKNKHILLVDSAFNWEKHKTWCFWDDTSIPEKSWIESSWQLIETATNKGVYQTVGEPHYFSIHSKKFRDKILETARNIKNITLLETTIQAFQEDRNKATLKTEKGKYSATWIFTSATSTKPARATVMQHFKGFFIQTQQPFFDTDRIMLMDFRLYDIHIKQTAFFYVLPYSEKEALVEFTLFSDEVLPEYIYDESIKKYLNQGLKLSESEYTVTGTEFGIIPMSDVKEPSEQYTRIIKIGTVAGATKPTTGYTFIRIQQHCNQIIADLENGCSPSPFPQSKYRFRLYDRLLLEILKNNAHEGPRVFKKLLERNKLTNILKFLDEKSTLNEEIRIFLTLPWKPFLLSLSKHLFKLHRI